MHMYMYIYIHHDVYVHTFMSRKEVAVSVPVDLPMWEIGVEMLYCMSKCTCKIKHTEIYTFHNYTHTYGALI